MSAPRVVITDSSTLINFLAVGRTDLLTDNQRYRFTITEHVRAEITDHFPEQRARLDTLLDGGAMVETPLTAIAELELFVQLTTSNPGAPKPVGDGEAASIAAAILRSAVLALDDKAATKRALCVQPTLEIRNTAQLVIEAIQDSRIQIAAADALKQCWEVEHRFRLPFASFRDVT